MRRQQNHRETNQVCITYYTVKNVWKSEEKISYKLSLFSTFREAKTRIRKRDWLKLAGEKICREQVGTVPTYLSVRANKFAKWKIGFSYRP